MSKKIHDQKTDPQYMICFSCAEGQCKQCVDRLRKLYASRHGMPERICECRRELHPLHIMGEATLNQVQDPFTGTIHAPGLTVSPDGEVEFSDDPFV